ncbi:hypothetical protein ACH492_02810 [Streptomyces sp. NPDC019443]|uniref:hypothetical protein n=1 Tax=Streptomyces sp. NPDC019443 TaxID=3365061 RepID=UPI003797AEE2
MERFRRASVTGIATAVVLAGSVGMAMPVDAPTPPVQTADGSGNERPAPERPELSARVAVSEVPAWHQFRVYGATKLLPPGTKVTLQQKQGTEWVTLPASMNTTHESTFKMRVLLGIKGYNTLRITGGGTVSPEFTVTVR